MADDAIANDHPQDDVAVDAPTFSGAPASEPTTDGGDTVETSGATESAVAPNAAETVEASVAGETAVESGTPAENGTPAEGEGSEEPAEVDPDAEYRQRLREFTRQLKKQPGKWYIVQTYAAYENKVKTNLDMRAQTLEVEEYIHEVVVPIEQVWELKDGKKKLVKRKLLPGYVLVRMDMNERAWSVVRDTPGVTSFVGNEGNATVVKHRDVAKFLMPKDAPTEEGAPAPTTADGEMVVAMPDAASAPAFSHDFQVGDAVTILSGAFASVSATINAIDPATGKLEALVSIFGRETPVELTPDQVEKIN